MQGNDDRTDKDADEHFFYTVRRDRTDGDTRIPHWGRIVVTGITAIILLSLVAASLNTVDAGERAVVFHADGSLTTLQPGKFQFVMPIVNSVERYNVRSELYPKIADGLSEDKQLVTTEIAVLFHPDPDQITTIHQTLGHGYTDSVVAPSVEDAVKAAVSYVPAENLTGATREIVKQDIIARITNDLRSSNLIVDRISLTDFDFSGQYNLANEAKVVAKSKAVEAENKLVQVEFEAQQTVAIANGAASADIARANGTAQAILTQAQANSAAIRLFIDALKDSPPDLVAWIQATAFREKWNGQLPYYMGGGQDSNSPAFFLPGGSSQQFSGNSTASG